MDFIEIYQAIIDVPAGIEDRTIDKHDPILKRWQKFVEIFFTSDSFLNLCRYWNGYIFNCRANIDEIRNAIFMHLMENQCSRLKKISDPNTLLGWINRTAIRYLIRHKDEFIPDWKPNPKDGDDDDDVQTENQIQRNSPDNSEELSEASSDVETLLASINNARYVFVIRELYLAERSFEDVGKEMGIDKDHLYVLYNIKKRALAALTKVAIKDIKHYANK